MASQPTGADVAADLERYRTELTGYCYRMMGSAFEADDAAQETLIRAWRGYDRFEGRSALRSWLYKIATNVCLELLRGRERRARPMDLASPVAPSAVGLEPLPETAWLGPVPDDRVLAGVADTGDPAEVAVARESIRLAFVAALQRLPGRQRAALILCEVLGWKASEAAALLESSVPSVNSALQRARATLGASGVTSTDPLRPADEEQRELLGRYVDAFERYDMDSLTSLLHADAVLSMPPLPHWLRGTAHIREWMLGTGSGCRGSRLIPTVANGTPAYGQYRRSASGSGYDPWALQVIEISDGRITGMNQFLDTDRLFGLFGLPSRLPD